MYQSNEVCHRQHQFVFFSLFTDFIKPINITLSCILLINGQTYSGENTLRFSKYVWPFFDIMHERLNAKQSLLPKTFSAEHAVSCQHLNHLRIFKRLSEYLVKCLHKIY